MNPEEILEQHDTFAVVGATENKKKFGYKIYRMLKQKHKVAFPVNPRYKAIDGDRCYPSIAAIDPKPEVAVAVVPPRITDSLIETCKEEGIVFLWLQPGTYTKQTIEKAKANGLTVIHGACIIDEMSKDDALEFHFP
jgi:predicted CoA-binding protein